jgi:hypothetical protein
MANYNQQVAHARAELVKKHVIGPIAGSSHDGAGAVICGGATAGTRFVPCVDARPHVLNDAAADLRADQVSRTHAIAQMIV